MSKIVLALAASSFLLAACQSASINPPNVCPPLVAYHPEFMKRASAELDLLPDNSAVVSMMADYAMTRDMIRACQAARR